MATAGNCFNLRHLGHVTISKFTPGLGALQKPLHDLYVAYLTPKGPKMPVSTRLALTDRGIILTTKGQDAFHSMRDILLWEPVHWVHVLTKDKKIMSAFESTIPGRHHSQEGLFSKLESQYRYLAQLKHDAVLAMALKTGSDAKHVEVHAFVCGSNAQVFEVAQALWRAEQVFVGQEAKRVGAVTSSSPQSQDPSSKGGGVSQGKAGKQSARQAKGRKVVEGEITLEELIRLADRALDDPAGERQPDREHRGLQRSRTFNEGSPREDREARREEVRRGSNEGRAQNPGSGMEMMANQSPHPLPCYENVAAASASSSSAVQPRVYENVSKNSAASQLGGSAGGQPEVPNHHHHRLPVSADDRGSGPSVVVVAAVDPRRKSVPPDALHAAVSDSRPSAPNSRRPSAAALLLPPPGTDNFPGVDDPAPPSRPVALVQPRKVPRFKVLPEVSAAEGVVLHKAPQNNHVKGGEAAAEGGGGGGGGRNFARSMYELNNCVAAKPVGSPQGHRKQSKMANSELNLARKSSSNPDPDPGSKKSNPVPESSSGGGGSGSSGEKKNKKKSAAAAAGERGKKDAEIEALAMSADLQHPPANTMSAQATNFENALGYFP